MTTFLAPQNIAGKTKLPASVSRKLFGRWQFKCFSCLIIQFVELISLIFGSSSAKNNDPIIQSLIVLSCKLKKRECGGG